jgi:mycothione reductase
MQRYDIIVCGSGCGLDIARQGMEHGKRVAMIEPGLLGGTCLNVGCIPTKMLVAPADMIVETERAKRLGVSMHVEEIDFAGIMQRMRDSRAGSQEHLQHMVGDWEGVTYVRSPGRFVSPGVVEAGGETYASDMVFITAGARPLIPPIDGLEEIDYLTNESALELTERPESMVIIGGGYIATEFCHFFAAMGTRVTVLEMLDGLVTSEEPEISAALQRELSSRMTVVTGVKVESVAKRAGVIQVTARKGSRGRARTYQASHVLVATGRRSNADILLVEKAGVAVDEKGFVVVDGHMRTNQKGVYAAGDITGKAMFRHAANAQAAVAAANALDGADVEMDYRAVPHAIYSSPQIAAVGLTEAQARESGYDVVTAVTAYSSVAKGEALDEDAGFTKVVVERGTERILGFHIVGPYAAMLIQEVVNAMQSGGHLDEIARGIHIHPELTELIPSSFEGIGA